FKLAENDQIKMGSCSLTFQNSAVTNEAVPASFRGAGPTDSYSSYRDHSPRAQDPFREQKTPDPYSYRDTPSKGQDPFRENPQRTPDSYSSYREFASKSQQDPFRESSQNIPDSYSSYREFAAKGQDSFRDARTPDSYWETKSADSYRDAIPKPPDLFREVAQKTPDSFREVVQKTPDQMLSPFAQNDLNASQDIPPIVYRHELEKKDRILRLFYELSHKLSLIYTLEEIYEQVIEFLLSVTSATRCFIFRKNEMGDFEQVAAKTRGAGEVGTPLPISKTIFSKVMAERVSVLLEEAQRPGGEMTSKSILANKVQSVMAAPIIGPRGLLGIIYTDRFDLNEPFSPDDLDLLNAIAVHTGIAINTVISHERLQKQAQARASFERFLPRQVVDHILRSPDAVKLGGERQMVTALFADIRNFTSLSENCSPEVIVNLLNHYFSMVSEIIFRHGGTLDKYIGDGLLALFGAPYVGELDAVQAVRAAIEIQRSMVLFNERQVAENLPQISVGIGINTGQAIVGYIGSETRLDYTAIGDTINTTSRLQNLAQPGQIVISENTMQVLDESFILKPLGTERLKGRNANLRIAEVVW
ncbi:MAG: GAF domain-containing protein, partial [Blastocatellia bacterium]|nr:GAF domain-containing protein [Blastocatellia bacterium]